MGHHHHHHHHSSSRTPDTYTVEPVTQRQKRVWRIKGIIWTVLAGIIVVASIALVIIFSVIDSKVPGTPFIVMPVFAAAPLSFAIPYLKQGYARKPQVTQIYDYGSYTRKKIVTVSAKVECAKCNTENEFGSTNCKECGETLAHTCPHCGAEIISNDEACRECGLALR